MDYLKSEFGLDVEIHRQHVEITDEHIESIKAMDKYKSFKWEILQTYNA